MAKDARGRELPKGIRQRDNGTFEGRVAVDGKRVSVYGNTVTEVKKKISETKYKMEHGIYVDQCNISFDEWFNTWLEEYKKNSVKSGTVFSYKNYYKYYIKDELGMRKLRDLRGEHIQHLYNKLKQDGIATSTIKIVSAVLSGCMKQALKNGLIERNPVPLAILPKAGAKKQSRVLTQEEQTLFLKYAKAKNSYLYNFFALALRTGMRNGELRGLKYSDIDKKKMVIHVVRTLKYEEGRGLYEDTPKTASSTRDIPLTEDMLQIIENQKKFWGISKIINKNEYVFHQGDKRPISRDCVQSEIDRVIALIREDGINFERFTCHGFRHTFATRAIESGMQPQTLKTILGHSTLSMTMDLYSHVLPSTKAEEMEAISGAFKIS